MPAPVCPPDPAAPCGLQHLRSCRAALLGGLLLGPCVAAQAQEAHAAQVAKAPARAWDAAVGFVVSHGPAYPGSARRETQLTPGLALRWGRVSLSSRSAFSVRSSQAGAGGGLRIELADGERLRVGLGLRADSGRRESDSVELAGLGDVRRTLRLRLSASYRLDGGWRLRSVTAADLLGRGGGLRGELQTTYDRALSATLGLNSSLSLGWGDARYMQAYYGVTPEQAARSGYPVSSASAGLRELSLGLGLRQQLAPRWAVFGGASVSRLVGQAADSPLTREPDSWNLNLGLVHRF